MSKSSKVRNIAGHPDVGLVHDILELQKVTLDSTDCGTLSVFESLEDATSSGVSGTADLQKLASGTLVDSPADLDDFLWYLH